MPLGRGVRLPITVLFADIRGFTAIAERFAPHEVVGFLNEYIGVVTPILLRHDGCIDKLLGDGVMAVFGAPIVRSDHVAQAVQAAVELQDALVNIQSLGGLLRVGVGIHTGEAVVGNVGDVHVQDFTAIGDTVNVAARMQELARPGEVLATAEVYDQVAATYPHAPSWQAQLEGRNQPVTVYRLRGG